MSRLMCIMIMPLIVISCHNKDILTWDCPNSSSQMIYSSTSGTKYIIKPNANGWITLEVPGEILSVDWHKENLPEARGGYYIVNESILVSNRLYRDGYDSIGDVACSKLDKEKFAKFYHGQYFLCVNKIMSSETVFSFDADRGITSMWRTDEPISDRMMLESRFGLGKPC